MEKTRSASKCPLFGNLGELKGNVLPMYDEVMKFYESMRYRLKSLKETHKEPSFSDIAEKVTLRVEEIWQTASIPTVSHTRVTQMLRAYHLKCKNLLKSIKRLSPDKLNDFLAKSRVLFDISSCKCQNINMCECPKERKVPKKEQSFLIDQRTSRKMIIGGVDICYSKRLEKNLNRKRKLEKPSTSTATLELSDFSATSSSEDCESGDKFTLVSKRIQHQKEKNKPTSISFPTLSKTCDRYGVSDRAAAAIASSVLHDIKANINVVDRHKLRRERIKTRDSIVKKAHISDVSALYFDGRKDRTLKIVKKVEETTEKQS